MKDITIFIQEALSNTTKKGFVYDIDTLSNTDWKSFAKAVAHNLSVENHLDEPIDVDTILLSLKGLAGDDLKLKVEDFRLVNPDFDKENDYVACDPINKYYSLEDQEWYDENGK